MFFLPTCGVSNKWELKGMFEGLRNEFFSEPPIYYRRYVDDDFIIVKTKLMLRGQKRCWMQ